MTVIITPFVLKNYKSKWLSYSILPVLELSL